MPHQPETTAALLEEAATAAGLINELVEAQHNNQFRRVLARWFRYELIAIDEVGYVPMADLGAELLFQVISDRAERATVILTTNLPFSEWTQVFPNVRLCKALLDRITDRAHIIETAASGRKGETGEKIQVLRIGLIPDRRFPGILEQRISVENLHGGNRKKQPKERNSET